MTEDAIREALLFHDWALKPTARALGCSHQRLRRVLLGMPELEAERRRLGPGRGRPRGKAALALPGVALEPARDGAEDG